MELQLSDIYQLIQTNPPLAFQLQPRGYTISPVDIYILHTSPPPQKNFTSAEFPHQQPPHHYTTPAWRNQQSASQQRRVSRKPLIPRTAKQTNNTRRSPNPPIHPGTSRLRKSPPRSRSNRNQPKRNPNIRQRTTKTRLSLHSPNNTPSNALKPLTRGSRNGPILLQLQHMALRAGNLFGRFIRAA